SAEGAAKATALVEKALAAMGGKEKLAAIKDTVSTGKLVLSMPQGKMEADSTEEVLYPDRYKMVLKLPMGLITQSYNAGGAWMSQGAMVQDMPPNMASEVAKGIPSANGGVGLLLAASNGKAEVQSIDATTVLWKAPEFEATLGFDAATGRLVKITMKGMGMGGPAEMQTEFSDFAASEGLTLPAKETILENGNPAGVRTISDRKVNAGVRAEGFAKPAK
ncbi:MAG: hypothetical protein HY821_12945, partial [Acidobacteria bacterium]|nr:hypothetical protein [Acidobacteriota bacterium]